jgi:uncharacterized membrane protein YeaQ/YmgE (transglycosylase-associated protein family)
MHLTIWLIVGGVAGWLASLIMRTEAHRGIVLNIVVGIVGSGISGLVFAGGHINDGPLTLGTFILFVLGALRAARHRESRPPQNTALGR